MARRLGSWWTKDGVDGRRLEAQGFCSMLDGLSGFAWTEDHGDSNVLEKDFVETTSYAEKVDKVDAVMMSSHGNPNSFSVWDGSVSTSDNVKFGKGDLEIFATHACNLLEHTASNSVGRWIPACDRLHYMFGFHTGSFILQVPLQSSISINLPQHGGMRSPALRFTYLLHVWQ
jgi:hypothetical protein